MRGYSPAFRWRRPLHLAMHCAVLCIVVGLASSRPAMALAECERKLRDANRVLDAESLDWEEFREIIADLEACGRSGSVEDRDKIHEFLVRAHAATLGSRAQDRKELERRVRAYIAAAREGGTLKPPKEWWRGHLAWPLGSCLDRLPEEADREKAKEFLFDKCLPQHFNCQVQLRAGEEAYRVGQFGKALGEDVQRCVQPGSILLNKIRAHALLARSYLAEGEAESAKEELRDLLRIDPDFVPDARESASFLDLLEQARNDPQLTPGQRLQLETCVYCLCDDDDDRICEEPSHPVPPSVTLAGPWEVGFLGGFFLPDGDLSAKSETLGDAEPFGGLRAAFFFGEQKRWGWFADATIADFNTETDARDADVITVRTGVELLFSAYNTKVQWFLSVGGGWMDVELENDGGVLGSSFDRVFLSAGFGQRFQLDRRAYVRWRHGWTARWTTKAWTEPT